MSERETFPGYREHQSREHERRLRRWLAEDDRQPAREWHPGEEEARQRAGDRRQYSDQNGDRDAANEGRQAFPASRPRWRGEAGASSRDDRREDDWRRRERARQEEDERRQEQRAHDWRDELGMGDFSFGRDGQDRRDDGQQAHDARSPRGARGTHTGGADHRGDHGPQRADEMLHLDWERSARLRGDYGDYGHVQDDHYREMSPLAAADAGWPAYHRQSGQGDNALPSGRHGAWHHDGGTDTWQRSGTGHGLPGGQGSRRHRRPPRGYVRSDERIREDICERLMTDPYVDAGDVSVEVRGGVVHLEGSVAERNMRYALESVAASCSGVKDVENHVRVQSGNAWGADRPADPSQAQGMPKQGQPDRRQGTTRPDAAPGPRDGNAGDAATGDRRAQQTATSSPSSQDAGLTNTSVSDTHGLGGADNSDPSRFIRTHTD